MAIDRKWSSSVTLNTQWFYTCFWLPYVGLNIVAPQINYLLDEDEILDDLRALNKLLPAREVSRYLSLNTCRSDWQTDRQCTCLSDTSWFHGSHCLERVWTLKGALLFKNHWNYLELLHKSLKSLHLWKKQNGKLSV
jgi:hypothetical protein